MRQRNNHSAQGYWFFLYPYVYLNVKAGKIIIYNTLNKVLLEYDSPKIFKKMEPLFNGDTSVIDIGNLSCDETVNAMIKDVRNSFSGDLIPKSLVNRKPFQFQPKLFFDNSTDPEYKEYSIPVLLSEQPKDYLEELSIYINRQCEQKCRDCKSYYKQTYFCTTDNHENMYPFDDLKELLIQANKTALKRVNILGGNIFLYPQIFELINYLNDYLANIYYHINHLNLNSTTVRLINSINRDKDMFVILINPPFNESPLNTLLNTHNLKESFFTFIVSSEQEFNQVAEFIEKYSLKNISVVPIYAAENKSFFERNVYVTKENIVEDQTDILSILRRGYLNDAGFKKLFVKPDKKIFSNLNLPAIADLSKNTLLSAIKHELKEGTFWKLLRKNVTPCRDCTFQLMCPPVSNYDFALNKHNLCTILEKEK